MSLALLPLTGATYQRHPMHTTERIWTETNCYVDVWVELLHSLGLNPLAAAAFTLSADFEGDQWTFFKYPAEDLREVYGIDVHEMNPWRGTLEHTVEQLRLGRLLTVEANSYFLPDTHGVSYRIAQVKSTIVPNAVDVASRRLGYFHNAGYFELEGDDFDGVFHLGEHADPMALPPYVEIVRLDGLRRLEPADEAAVALRLLGRHVERRPADNPVDRLAERVEADVAWLRDGDIEDFHLWAFGTLRQCGASAELAGEFCRWLAARVDGGHWLSEAAEHWTSLAATAKSLQFLMARVARGRTADLGDALEGMAKSWTAAQELCARPVAPPR